MTDRVNETIEKSLAGKSEEIQELFFKLREILINHDERLTESIKWGMPSYDYKTIVVGLGAFKNHVSIWFHKGAIMKDELGLFSPSENRQMGQIKFEPGDVINIEGIKIYLDEAISLNEAGIKQKKAKPNNDKTYLDSNDLMAELLKHQEAAAFFNSLTKNQQNNFTTFVEDAKQEATKRRRIERTIDRLSNGFKTTH
ncbi:MAG: DUF1801 domain-containing protein [Flavobacteriales bacterium]|nr:DUF1801 domain-containing protein [Flavobacteriales bacterium]MCB9198034.1 DUF1801 domain-containing protein [Flavobacteriales bacterium]